MRKGIREFRRKVKGDSYIAVGVVTDHKKVGCPPCDTVYLQLHRDAEEVLFMALTPEEADIIARLFHAVVRIPGV